MRVLFKCLGLAFLVTSVACDSPTQEEQLDDEAVKLEVWAADAVLVSAVQAQNAQNLTLAEIMRRDAAWVAGQEPSLVTAVTTGTCATRLRALLSTRSLYGEALLMDNQGALVCSSDVASDYWQGDEDKWRRSYNNGNGTIFIDSEQFDQSAGELLVQISLPVRSGTTTIGALTVGVRVSEL